MINLLHNLFFLLVVMCVFLLNSVNGHHFPLIGSQTTNSTALLLSASPGSFALLGGRGGPEGGELLGNEEFVCESVCLSVRVSARCDWSTGDYLRKGRHRPGLRLTSLGDLTKMPPKSSNKGDRSRARDPRARGNGTGKGICITGLLH
jgi:hypothetical protein